MPDVRGKTHRLGPPPHRTPCLGIREAHQSRPWLAVAPPHDPRRRRPIRQLFQPPRLSPIAPDPIAHRGPLPSRLFGMSPHTIQRLIKRVATGPTMAGRSRHTSYAIPSRSRRSKRASRSQHSRTFSATAAWRRRRFTSGCSPRGSSASYARSGKLHLDMGLKEFLGAQKPLADLFVNDARSQDPLAA